MEILYDTSKTYDDFTRSCKILDDNLARNIYSFMIPLEFRMILHDKHSTLTGIASKHRNKA